MAIIATGTGLSSFRIIEDNQIGTHSTIYGVSYEAFFFGEWKQIDTVTSINQNEDEAIAELIAKACKKWNLRKDTIKIGA